MDCGFDDHPQGIRRRDETPFPESCRLSRGWSESSFEVGAGNEMWTLDLGEECTLPTMYSSLQTCFLGLVEVSLTISSSSSSFSVEVEATG